MKKLFAFFLMVFTVCLIDAKITDRISSMKKPVIASPIYTFDQDGNKVPYKLTEDQKQATRQLGKVQLNIESSGITLSQSGNYILASNITDLTAPITISGSNINLDLNGFLVSNTSGVGIDISGGAGIKNIIVRNGTVSACGGDGIAVDDVQNLVLDSILSVDNSSDGFAFGTSCNNCVVNKCRAQNNTS
ncbi:unnamed protein product, partial [marine sediment metagenome]